jgi:hypothetical protein
MGDLGGNLNGRNGWEVQHVDGVVEGTYVECGE